MPQGSLIESMQANVPNYVPRTPVSLDDTFSSGGTMVLQPANVVTSSGNDVAVDAYNGELPANPKARTAYIRNLGTTPMKVAYNQTATNDGFHDIVAGGSAQDDGLGAQLQVDIAANHISRISLVNHTAAVRAAVVLVTKV